MSATGEKLVATARRVFTEELARVLVDAFIARLTIATLEDWPKDLEEDDMDADMLAILAMDEVLVRVFVVEERERVVTVFFVEEERCRERCILLRGLKGNITDKVVTYISRRDDKMIYM